MPNRKRGLLIIIAGPSGVGKGTVRGELYKDPTLSLFYSVSLTTRPMRPGEKEGVDYYFVSEKEFDKRIASGRLLEWTEFVGHRYGTPRDIVDKMRDAGKNVILEIEVKGTVQVLNKCKGDPGLVSIFILPPSLAELERRIRHRSTEAEDVVKKRLARAIEEMALKSYYQYRVVNDDYHRAAREIADIIRSRAASAE